jgi:hypothetical protein
MLNAMMVVCVSNAVLIFNLDVDGVFAADLLLLAVFFFFEKFHVNTLGTYCNLLTTTTLSSVAP